MNEQFEETPTFTLFEDIAETAPVKKQERFFDLSDVLAVEAEPAGSGHVPTDQGAAAVARKVNPLDIPAGHVDLTDSDRTPIGFDSFELENPESFVSRTVKGRYVVTEYLGGDETGLAYLAEDRIADRKVLVRILFEDDSDPVVSSILAEERVSLSHLSHPNIARLIDSGAFTNGIQFLISEYSDALSARDIQSIHDVFQPQRAARVIKQAAYALSEAHQEGIIHRDIRPENFILAKEGDTEVLKLVNFGASNGEPNERNAIYKAPEVLDGRTPSASSDIYSLAIVAYEMLTGKLPFTGATKKELLRSQYAGLKTRASEENTGLPPAIDEVFEKALSFKSIGRYAKARDFGDAVSSALHVETPPVVEKAAEAAGDDSLLELEPLKPQKKVAVLKPIETTPKEPQTEPAWKSRSPEPPQEENATSTILAFAGFAALVALLIFAWYYLANRPTDNVVGDTTTGQTTPTIASDAEMPPLPRKITQPTNSNYFANSKQNLKGDLIRNFVGFSLYYPKDWKLNAPVEGGPGTRGKFLDIARLTPDGKPKEQMLVSYYPSKGTFNADAAAFPQLVKEANETLKKILPGYQVVSEGEIKVNGDWRAYEVKFQSTGTAPNGEPLTVWGRRLFMPAARPGVRNGFEITMLATSLDDDVKSVDDVGVHGELAQILYSFEPSQNF